MRVIIAGSRNLIGESQERLVNAALNLSPYEITEVVSGTAAGVDRYGEMWAEANGIPIKRFPADWKAHGRGAGLIRNGVMAEYADALVYVWYEGSRGTAHMINTMVKMGKPTWGVTIASSEI